MGIVNPDELRTRSLNELLEAERLFRRHAEGRVRSLSAVLTELAYRLGGDKLELLRKQDATIPQSWSPDQWRAFFQALTLDPGTTGWGGKSNGNGNGHHAELKKHQEEIQRLKSELEQARRTIAELKLEAYSQQPTDIITAPSSAHSDKSVNDIGYGYAHIPLWEWQQPLVPASYADRIRAVSSATRRDAQVNERRKLLTMWLLSYTGISSQIEIGRLIGVREGISSEAGSIKRPIEALVESNLLSTQTLTLNLGNTPTRLVVLRLSQDGKDLCRLWDYPNVESDWERLIRSHEAERQEGHTLAVLLFAAHARMRGWRTTVLPDVEGTPARPDVYIENGEAKWYVEVEVGDRDHDGNAKWRNLAELQDGRVALCARTIEERKVLVGDCQQWHGVATDLESMIGIKLKHIRPGDELWVYKW
ncbi:MAG: hypothetical protein ANABAC_1293 [Anaerolineae bacterium]|nr:MAG: hypothetical protein ANABAC_1293 [Anaerolineae bacterium]